MALEDKESNRHTQQLGEAPVLELVPSLYEQGEAVWVQSSFEPSLVAKAMHIKISCTGEIFNYLIAKQ